MPSVIGTGSSRIFSEIEEIKKRSTKTATPSMEASTPQKRRLRSDTLKENLGSSPLKQCSPGKWKSPRRCMEASPNSGTNGILNGSDPVSSASMQCSPVKWRLPRRCSDASPNGRANGIVNGSVTRISKSPRKRLSDSFPSKPKWDPKDSEQMSVVKEALHVSTSPFAIVCREEEQKRLLDFCKTCIEHERPGSLYVCGCPGTGKTLSMEKVKALLLGWVQEAGYQTPDVLAVNCTSLANTSEIFSKILRMHQPQKKINSTSSPLQRLQKLFSQKKQLSGEKMMLIIADEMDYLINKDCSVLHELFLLTTLPSSRCILIGVANAIDLASRFLPKLQSLSCKPMVVTFRAYSKDQILRILRQRLMALPYDVFQEEALELCARKVAAASGDMRKALFICRSAIEMLEAELTDPSSGASTLQANGSPDQPKTPAAKLLAKHENMVRVDHMAIALSRTFKSAIVDTIQSLPQHQQMVLCSILKFFQRGKKDTTIGELNRCYSEICKSASIPPASFLEFANMCKVLSDQGLLKLGQSREDRLKRVTLKVDDAEITFALQGIRFFRICLQ